MTKKFQLIMALLLALIISAGVYAYAYTTAGGTIGIAEPTGDFATWSNETATQPDWNSVLDDLASDNKTCGDVPTGNLTIITPDFAYSGDLMVGVYLTNTGSLIKAYQHLNMKVYMSGSAQAEETPDYQVITLQNGQANFSLEGFLGIVDNWIQTSQSDFESGNLNNLDTTTSPGDVLLDTFSDDVTDSFADETKIASSENLTVSGGQVKLTLVNATETLRPSAAGDETNIESQYPATGEHWDKVDEATSDNDTTYVYTLNRNWQEDLYNADNHSAGTGTINYVKVYMVSRVTQAGGNDAYVHIKTNGVEYNGTTEDLTTGYATYSYQWDNNPQTTAAWTWDEIDALQIGVGITRPRRNQETRVTQVYAEVNYSAYEPTGTITSTNLLSGETVVSTDNFTYNASAIPSGTGLKVQFSQDNTNWYNSSGNASGWDTLSQGTDNIDLSGLGWSGANFYYHMQFSTSGDRTDTPVLDEIAANFSTYSLSGDLTSSNHNAGYDAFWRNIVFTINELSGTDIKFQLRSAATEGGLSSATWYGPAGTGDYYTTTGTAINDVHDGDRWIQYKAYFTSPGDNTPTLSDITITYATTTSSYTVEIVGGGYCLISDNTSEWGAGWTTTPELYCEVTQR
jgi:hypothetical protein